MVSNLELLQTRERLFVGRRFLMLRPRIAGVGALANAVCLALSSAPLAQRMWVALVFGGTVAAFFAESAWLRRYPLSERWLFWSLLSTLLTLGFGTSLSGGILSPFAPLLFAPSVVGFAAFARSRQSAVLFGVTLLVLGVGALYAPWPGFAAPAAPWGMRMALISSLTSLSLLAVGVIGLVDAHGAIAAQLERMRLDTLREAERRALSVELLGAQVAHDVKNPLTAARGLVQLVQRNLSAERDRERLSVVVQETDRALALLHGYLRWARPLTDLVLAETDVRALLEDLVSLLEARALERNVQLSIVGPRVRAAIDRQKLHDALLNLALNALNALPQGGALSFVLNVEARVLRVTVVDTGSGMSEAQLARLGEPFASEADAGTGLGVLLARGVAQQHGGSLTFESAQGKGTRAMLELPLGPGA